MEWTRAAIPAGVAALAALIFAVIDPSSGGDLTGRLHWASLGGVLWGLGSLIAMRTSAAKPSIAAGIALIAVGVVTFAITGELRWALLDGIVVGLGTFIAIRTSAPKRLIAAGATITAVAAVTFLVLKYTEKSDRLASTMFSVVVAVSLIAGTWILLNAPIEQARKNWAVFSAIASALVAALAFAIMRGNLSLQSLVVEEDLALFGAGSGFLGHIEWPLFGALVWGLGVFALRQFEARVPRLAIGVGLGVLTGWQIGDNSLLRQRPNISWGSAIIWTAILAIIGGLWRVRNDAPVGATADAAMRDVPVIGALSKAITRLNSSFSQPDLLGRATPGMLTGAIVGFTFAVWFRSDFIGSGTDGFLAAAVPLAILGIRIAWNRRPDATHIATFENRAQTFIFLGPALLFLSSALVIPAFRRSEASSYQRSPATSTAAISRATRSTGSTPKVMLSSASTTTANSGTTSTHSSLRTGATSSRRSSSGWL